MKSTLIAFLLLGIAATQDLHVDHYDQGEDLLLSATAPSGSENATPDAGKRSEPTACVEQAGNGPHVDPDTDTAFLTYPAFSQAATAAAINPPAGYTVISGWTNLNSSNGDGTGYLGYVQSELSSYDPLECSRLCSNWSGSTTCASFVIYYERDPELIWSTTGTPSSEYCPATASSPSVTLIKCAFYSVPVYSGNATNFGQYWSDFHVVITGSTAFSKLPSPVIDGWDGPVDLHDAGLNIPAPPDQYGYLRNEIFSGDYDPATCASHCEAITAYNQAQGSSTQCTSFNAYVLLTNGADGVFTCTYYSQNYGISYATNTGQYDQAGNHYTISNSFAYYLTGSPTPMKRRSLSFFA
ncbi:hypothetical protein VP1G_02962 [Cytospora mali]|uniref:Uncharacterized protein n=1 Tax=Cytospora mali TaxID=578113 RepID=A0A194UVA0_CYTMA|nr:hypothetical protein VP1G_02962 [Valsa mali var. pyri (nom. inval.)]